MAGGTAGARLGQSGEPGISGGCRLSLLSKAPSAPHYPPPTSPRLPILCHLFPFSLATLCLPFPP